VVEPREPAYAETIPQNVATAAIFLGAILGAVVFVAIGVVDPWYLSVLLGAVGGVVLAGVGVGVVAALLNRSTGE
jgi:ABC-type polysaccharide/polyol phosphate export permease